MRCPVDGETLVMADRSGVEIDYCPKCRGVWLDRGELDKIIERAAGGAPVISPREAAAVHLQEPRRAADPYPQEPRRQDDRSRYHDDDDDDRRGYKRKRRESFLSDLFDF